MRPAFVDDPVTVYCADVLEGLAALADESVQCCVTSPPYWGLRDYGVEGQLGLEATPDEYVARMVAVFREVRRVLRKDGTLWLNMGDGYAANRSYQVRDSKHVDVGNHMSATVPPGLKPKDLIGLPWQLAFALRTDGWWLRSDIIWAKNNPMPESVTDRPTRSHEYVFLLTKAARYYYDADAVRIPATQYAGDLGIYRSQKTRVLAMGRKPSGNEALAAGNKPDKQRGHGRRHAGFNDRWDAMTKEEQQVAGANLRDVWTIATQGYPGAHFATFPDELARRCIAAGSAEGDTVLDPFAGSGTTLAVARRMGRKSIGIELNPGYVELIRCRVADAALPLVEMAE